MSCQNNPNTYAIVARCPLEIGARLKTLADKAGQTMSQYIADMICERVGDVVLTDEENIWAAEHFEMHKVRRARADRMSAAGYFKRRKRGRPRKPGPKGKKRKRRTTKS